MPVEIESCRLCGNRALRPVLSLGSMALSGVFPRRPDERVTTGPLDVVACDPAGSPEACGLVQLRQTYDPREMYGEGYGYRSSLNDAMVRHLAGIAERTRRLVEPQHSDVVVDIGSNDGTLLSCFAPNQARLVGIDPTAAKFRRYYRADIEVIDDFFSASLFRARFAHKKARVVTSIAMLYDLPDPLRFVRDVAEILDDDGVWCFEQAYLPAMLTRNAYDAICHEHLEYYGLRQIKWMTDRAGLRILDVATNDINGGSLCVTAAKAKARWAGPPAAVSWYVDNEAAQGLDRAETWEAFRRSIDAERTKLLGLLDGIRGSGGTVLGYGASTKGNILLQYCRIGPERLPFIAEVNESKFGCFTPGTHIPIGSEEEARARRPDYFLVLPWHFRDGVVRREEEFLRNGGKLIFPLPQVEIVSA